MNELRIFENSEFGEIRTTEINNVPYFCMVDICKALGLEQVSRAKERLNNDGVTTSKVIDSLGRVQEANFINESNMYKLIFQSRKDSAERFTEWVTSEVLPSIRRTGSYQKPLSALELLKLQGEAIIEVNDKIKSVSKDLEEFKEDMPLFAIECQKITYAVCKRGINAMGGKESNSYKDSSIRAKVYSDIHRDVKNQFGVTSYKAIKRSQCDLAISIIDSYELPLRLIEEIRSCNRGV